MEFEAASTTHTIKHLMLMMNDSNYVHYVRFGDNEIGVIGKINKKKRRHRYSHELRTELIEAIKIKDPRFVKAVICGYPKEPGMTELAFLPNVRGKEGRRLNYNIRKIARFVGQEKFFYNPIAFHYVSIYRPKLLHDFMDKYVRFRTKMFVGSMEKKDMERFYGKIDYYIKIPDRQSYYCIDQWWPKILENIDNCEVFAISAGAASAVVSKRLWQLNKKIHCINLGSVNNMLEGDEKIIGTRHWKARAWAVVNNPRQIRRNLLNK